MKAYIIDTNFFVNMEIKSGFGKTSKEIIERFVPLALELKQQKKAEFYIPPRIEDELVTFFEKEPFFSSLMSVLQVKSPTVTDLQFPATVFYLLVEEIRERSYRGLRIAEESVENGAKASMNLGPVTREVFQKSLTDTVKNLRDRYRQATRFQFLDSVADLDLITLTKELDGNIVSSDEGVVRWGRLFGVKETHPSYFRETLLAL